MNIVTVIPNSFGYPTNSVGTDAVRRDNVLREAIPSVTQGERSAAERGLASDGERNSQAANQANLFQNPTYERPTVSQAFANNLNGEANRDNAHQESAGKENAESKQEQQNDDKEVRGLRERDREVRMHEQAHAAVGGQYAGVPSYEYQSGPDGKRYAVGGEVLMDVAAENTPADTIRKMQQVKAAALAPVEPSAQDYKVAADATQKEKSARSELSKEQTADVSLTTPPHTDMSMAGIDAGRQVLKAGLELDEQTQRTSAVVSSFYAGVFTQSQSSMNFTV